MIASRLVRPSQVYRVAVNVLRSPLPMMVRASIQRNGVEISADHQEVKEGIPETLMMRMPPTSVGGDYKLRVEGMYNSLTGGQAFLNETHLAFSQRSMTIFIQLDKPVYMQGESVQFRTILIDTELKAFNNPIDVYMLDPYRRVMRRWLSRQSNLGTVSLSYQLSNQPVFGEWIIQVIAQGQVEEKTFLVEEYYQTRFEVNVTMPAFFFDSDPYVHGIVQANYTSGAPVRGNLTLRATFRPIDRYRGLGQTTAPALYERYLDFNEEYPRWYRINFDELQRAPTLRFFNGTYHFRFPMDDLRTQQGNLEGVEITITATVGERFLEEVITGWLLYSWTLKSRILKRNSLIDIKIFLHRLLNGKNVQFHHQSALFRRLAASIQAGHAVRHSPASSVPRRIAPARISADLCANGGSR